MSWETAWEQSLGRPPQGGFVDIVDFVKGGQEREKVPDQGQEEWLGKERDTQNHIYTPRDNIDRIDKMPPLNTHECQEVTSWPVQTQRVYARLLDHFETRGFPLLQAERLSFTTLMVLKKRKGWPLLLVHDLPPEIGRAVGMVLDAFPGTKLMNYRHKTGTAQ